MSHTVPAVTHYWTPARQYGEIIELLLTRDNGDNEGQRCDSCGRISATANSSGPGGAGWAALKPRTAICAPFVRWTDPLRQATIVGEVSAIRGRTGAGMGVIAISESADGVDRTPAGPPHPGSAQKSRVIARYLFLFLVVVLPLGAIGGDIAREAYLVQTNQAQHGIFIATNYDCGGDGGCSWHGDFIPSGGGPATHGVILDSGNTTRVGDEIPVQAVQDLNVVDAYALGSAPEWMWPVGGLLMAGAVFLAWYFARLVRRRWNKPPVHTHAIGL